MTSLKTPRASALWFALAALAVCARGRAQDRPSEADLFGAPTTGDHSDASDAQPPAAPDAGVEPLGEELPGPAGAASGSAAQSAGRNPAASAASERDEALLGGSGASSRDEAILGGSSAPMFSEPAAPADPLSIGGQIYLRAQTTGDDGLTLDDYALSAPSLLDVYLDARPNDRVRGFVLGRLSYDPSVGARSTSNDPVGGSDVLSSLYGEPIYGPRVALDQLWLRFDIAHRAFVTAGKQHVRWGTGRFWSPTDYLHVRPRNPLDVFDARTGTSMIKLHVPIESEAWNFYGYVVTEGPDGVPQLEQVAGALRAELVFGQTELGLGVFARKDSKVKFAADVSSGVGDFDVYGELAVRDRSDIDMIRVDPDADLPDPIEGESWQSPTEVQAANLERFVDAYYPVTPKTGYRPQLVAGLSYSRKYNDNDTFTIAAEYFYNPLGYDSPEVYPGLILPRESPLRDPATFFYLGRHYAGLSFLLPAPFSLDLHSFTLSTLANLSDRSFISRLDYSLSLLTHLRFEAFAAVHYGTTEGEFRLGFEAIDILGETLTRAPALLDLGIGLRLAI